MDCLAVDSANMEYFDDLDPLSKNSKGSRRKQSKPVRVFFDEGETPSGINNGSVTNAPAIGPSQGNSMDTAEPRSDEKEAVESGQENITCGLCGDLFRSPVDLDAHIKKKHSEYAGEDMDMGGFPTKYHQLGNELSFGLNQPEPNDGENDMSAMDVDEDSGMDAKGAASGEAGKGSGRIFHPDAYCDICQKEFCNKYFLKTHKANKHGIYENGVGMPESGTGSDPGSGVSTPVSQPPSLPPPQSEAMPLTTTTPNTTSTPKPEPAEYPSPPSAPREESPTTNNKKSSTKAQDMEDYCEFCQKHFCNKYYLRKHKQDVHGIIPDATPGRRGRPMSSVMPGGAVTSLPMTSGTPIQNLPQPPLTAGSAPATNPTMANVMFLNPFMPPVALIQAQPVLHAGPAFTPIPGLATVPASVPQQQPTTAQEPMAKISVSSDTVSTTPSSGTDIKASEPASCDICHKEFCNRYFLNIHKTNKHGIKTEEEPPTKTQLPETKPGPVKEEPKASENIDNRREQPPDHLADLSRLTTGNNVDQNLLRQIANSAILNTSALELGKGHGDKSNGNMGSTMFGNMIAARLADRVMCEICNKEVCNKYFLKTHKMKVHGIVPSPNDFPDRRKTDFREIKKVPVNPVPELLEKIQRPRDDELLKMGIDPEAYCEICKKEFCSKYFLKTHKLNIHGIKVESPARLERPNHAGLDNILMNMPPLTEIKRESGLPDHKIPISIAMDMKHAPQTQPVPPQPQLQPPPPPPQPPLSQAPPPPPSMAVPPLNTANINIITTPLNPNNPDTPVRHTWKWKEPTASQRVTCEICNKELCNKYFLRTHKMNKHGIYEEGTPPSNKKPFGSQNFEDSSPMGSNSRDPSSGGSSPSQQTVPQGQMTPTHLMPYPGSDMSNENSMEATQQDPTRGEKPIHIQPLIENHIPEVPPAKEGTNGYGNPFIQRCDICGMIFGEEVTLHLHMIQDHQGLVTVKAETGIVNGQPPLTPTKTMKTSLSIKRKYRLFLNQKLLNSRRQNQIPGAKHKQFRCIHCHQKFQRRALCQAHIRTHHRNLKGSSFSAQGQIANSVAKTNDEVPVAYATPTEAKTMCTLQPFIVKVADSNNGASLVPCKVHLPVHQKFTEPCTLTLSLTPIDP